MSARLVPLISGSAKPISLARPVLLVGRHPECDVRLDLPQISRRHCCLATAYDRVTVRDLGSRHGIRVNGRAVDESRLISGDEVAIGHLIYRFEEAEPPAPPEPKAAEPAPEPESKPKPKPIPVVDEDLPSLPFDLSSLVAEDDDDIVPLTDE